MDYIRIGFITGTLGIKGELKVEPLTSCIERYDKLEYCYINTGESREKVYPESYRPYRKNSIIMKFKGYDDINSVLKYNHRYIEVDRENLVKLEEGQYFIFDIIGCKVYSIAGEYLGMVTTVLQPGGNDVYVVNGSAGQILVPALKNVIRHVDVTEKVIRVELPEGLIE